MAAKKQAQVIITANASVAERVMQELEGAAQRAANQMKSLASQSTNLKERMRQLEAEGKKDTDEFKALKEQLRQVEKQYKSAEKEFQAFNSRMRENVKDTKRVQEVMKDLAGTATRDLRRALQAAKRELDKMSAKDPNRRQLINEMKQIQRQIEKNTAGLQSFGKTHNSVWQSAVRNITAYVGVFGMFNAIKNGIREVIKGGAELSDQMAQVRMVSGLAMQDIEELTRHLAKMDTRTTLKELNEIAYAGAKLGFGSMGIEGLEAFTRAANQVNVALKESLGSEALTALSKITENMGLIKKMGVEQAMLSTSSAMFKLFTTSTAAAGPIVEVTKRLAPMAQISGFATHEVLALASANDALMQSEEVAGTALSKFIMAMQTNHNIIEKTLGLTEGSIAKMMKSGQSMEALMSILDKMHGKNVTELSDIWKLLGSDGDRLKRVILAMANHTDMVREHLDTATKAFKEATAVTEEYNIQQETAMAYLERAENKWRNAFINPDSSLAVKEMTKAWYDFTKSVTDSDWALDGISLTIKSLLTLFRVLIALIPMIAFGMMAKGAMLLYEKLLLAKIATDGFAVSWKKMDAATKSNWVGLIVGSLVQAVYWIKEFSSATGDAEKEQKKLSSAIENMHEKVDEETKGLDRLKRQLDDTNISQDERNALLSKVRTDYDIYLNYLGVEIKTVDELAKHYDALTKVMRQRFAYQEREEYKRDVMGGEDGLRMKRRNASADLKKKATELGIKELDIEAEIMPLLNQGANVDQVMAIIAPDLKRAAENVSKSESAARTFAGPGAAVGKRSGQSQKYLDLKSAFQSFADAVERERKKEEEIDAAFASEIGDFDYDKWLRTQVTGEFKVGPDKEAIKAAKKAQQEAKQAARKELKDLQEASTGILSKLEEYYRLQETAIQEARADGQLTEDQAKEMVRSLNIFKNESLATARRAITTGDTGEWDRLKKTILPAVLSDTSEVSRDLLDTIQKVAVDKLHNDLAKFNGSEGVFGLSSRAFFDQIRAKAAGNEREAARLRAKIQNEVEKALLEYQFVEKANRQMRKDVETMGITTETYEQWAKRMQEGITEKPDTILANGRTISDEQAYRQMGNKFVDMGVINFSYNIDNEEEARQWVRQFATDARGDLEGWAQAFPQLVEWIDLIKRKEQGETLGEKEQQALEQAMPSIRNLFYEMMRHADRLDKAMKDAFQHEKSQQESRFRIAGYKDQEEQADKYYSNQAKQQETGASQNFAQMLGLGSIANDPEILQIQNRIRNRALEVEDARNRLDEMKAMQDERIAKLRETAASEAEIHAAEEQYAQDRAGLEQLLADRQTALAEQTFALTTKTMQEVQKRSQAILKLSKPFTDAANNIGKKLGDMIRGAEEDSVTWEEIWKNMALAVGESVIEMTAQYMQNLIMQQSINRASEAEEAAHVAAEVPMGIAAGSAKTIGQLGWWGIPLVAVISALLMGLLQAALSTNRSSSTNASKAKTNVKLASGMLTYDRGNVGIFATRRKLYDDGTTQVYDREGSRPAPFVGQDGHVYMATPRGGIPEGVSLVKQPIATTVNGQPSLVAEKGPEIVIGRRTTARIMMNEPRLLHHLATLGNGRSYGGYRGLRTFDEGNLSETVGSVAVPQQQSERDQRINDALAANAAALEQNAAAMAAFSQVMQQIQANGIQGVFREYGAGSLDESMRKVNAFRKRYPV